MLKNRASSFDVIAVKVPYVWDGGRGFDYQGDYVKESHNVVSTDGFKLVLLPNWG